MTNYIDNLVARHLDTPIVVQPRLAALFEPPHAGRSMLPRHFVEPLAALFEPPHASQSKLSHFVEPFEYDSLTEESDDAGQIEPRRVPRDSFDADLGGPHVQASFNETPMAVWRGPQHLAPSSLSEFSPIKPSDVLVPVPVQPRPSPSQTAIATPEKEQATAKPPSSISTSNDVALHEVRRHSSKPVTPGIAQAAVKDDSHKQDAPPPPRPRLEPALADPKGKGIVVYPRVTSRVDSRGTTRAVPSPPYLADPQPEPTINVTIGRVEVRATLPATSPLKQSPAPPLMGLDEYLRKRAKGDAR